MKKQTLILVVMLALSSIAHAQWTQIGADIDGEAAGDYAGTVSINNNGTIVAVGSQYNDGNGNNSGHVRVFENTSGTWIQIGNDLNGEAVDDRFGVSVCLNGSGSIIAIGTPFNDGNGNNSGHVRVFENISGIWTQIGDDIDGEAIEDWSGYLSLNNEGNIIAIGGLFNDGNGNNSGHVRVFENNLGTWTQIGNDIEGEAIDDNSGRRASLSSEGSIVAIGAQNNDGNGGNSGHVRVFENIAGIWTQIGDDIDGEFASDRSSESISLSSDGSIIAIGARDNDGNGSNAGHVRIFENIAGTWTQIGQDIDGVYADDMSGFSVSLNNNGSIVAIGSPFNDGNGSNSGHVRVYKNTLGTWAQIGGNINGEAANDLSGAFIELSFDGNTVVIGAESNDGNGINAGHTRIYTCNSFDTIYPVSCDTYSSPNGKIWTSTGTYLDSIPNAMGCDSIITINLTINPLPIDIQNTNGLVAYYPFNNNANDESGNGLDGTIIGPVAVPDRFSNPNSAYSFDGSNDYILIGDPVPTPLQIQDEITLSAWIYATAYPGSSNLGLIVGSQCDGCGYTGASIFLDGRTNPNGITSPPGHIHFNFGKGSAWNYANSNSQVPLNQWVHIVATRKANEEAKIYYNGVLQPVNGIAWDGTVAYSGAFFAIGTEKNFSSRSFEGEIDDVCVYDRAISSEEVIALSQFLLVSADDDTICENNSTNINLLNSQSGISYQLIKDGTNAGSPQLSTGGDIVFNSGILTATSLFTIQATDNITGCSIILDTTLTITVNNINTGIDTLSACDSLVWIDGITYYATNNIATHTLTNVVGCDSVVTLDLTVNYSNTGIDTQTACDSLVWIDGITYYATNNIATHTLTNVAGCDSVVTLDLTVNYSNTGIDTQTACDSLVWINGNTYYATNNSATHTLTNAAGCDSLVTLDLTVNYANTGIDTQTACDSLVWIDGNTYYASNNTVTHTLTNAAGCDSVVTLDLTVNYSNTGIDTQTACDSLVWIDGNTYYASNNTVTHTLTNVAGCDSVVTLDLTVNYANTGIDTQTACDSLVWIDGNTYYASNNTATHTLTNVAGCDSVVTLDLTVNYSNTGIDTQTACDSLVWMDGNTYYASNNSATHTLTNAAGCDSLVTLDLTVNYSNTGIDTQTACDSLVWIDGNTYYTTNNVATHTLTNIVGCDSLVTLDLTVNYSNTGIDTQTACDSLVWIDGNTYYATNNAATHTLTNIAGCDSLVTLDLTINTVDVSVTVNSITLTATLSGATYQWVDCANSYAIIAGETNQSFTPTVNGDYAVIIDDGTCMDTSLCYLVTGVGISEDGISSAIVIYPNPTSGLITIEGEDMETIEVFDVNGKLIYKTDVVNRNNAINIDLSGEAKGVYYISINTNTKQISKNIIIN